MTEASDRPGEFVRSLERGLSVIQALSAPEPQSLSDVARTAGVSRAATRRFLLTLEHLGYVRDASGRFALTPKVLELGYSYLSSLSLPEVAQPHLERLTSEVHESSSISILDGNDIVYVGRVPTRRIMTVSISVGTRFPAYATSMGRVLLAHLPAADREAALDAVELRPITAATLTSREALERVLNRACEQGWAMVDQELEAGVRSVAVPIHDRAGGVVAAMDVSTHVSRATIADVKRRLLPPLLAAASRVEGDLRALA